MKAIHLIQSDAKLAPKPVAPGSHLFESGFWSLSIKQAESLIGGNIFFHEKQLSPSFFGGVITSYRVQQGGEWHGRVIFKFGSLVSHKGIRPKNPQGWNWVMNFEE